MAITGSKAILKIDGIKVMEVSNMEEIIVKNQEQLDIALKKTYKDYTLIKIMSNPEDVLIVKNTPDNSTVRACDNSTVRACDNSTVYAYNNSTVRAYSNSTVRACDNSTVEAYSNSTVRACDNSTVTAYDNSTVEAYSNSTVEACDNSTVEACDNSTVEAYSNSTVRAYHNSTVRAYHNSTVRAYHNSTVTAYDNSTVRAYHNSTVRACDISVIKIYSDSITLEAYHNSICIFKNIPIFENLKHSKTVTLLKQDDFKHSKKSFLEIYPPDSNNEVTLYKSVDPSTLCDFRTGTIKYAIGTEVICPDWDPNPELQCGGGLHLSPRPEMALRYNEGKVLECKVGVEDFVVFSMDITKVRCKKVRVVGEWK